MMKWMAILLIVSTAYAEEVFSLSKYPHIKCGDFLEHLENRVKNDIVVTHHNQKLRISLVWEDWWNIGISDNKLEWGKYRGFPVEINNGFILYDNEKFENNQLDDFVKKITSKAKDKNICIVIKFNEKMKDLLFLDTWVFLYAIHQLAHNRVAYIHFNDSKEKDEDHSSPPDRTAHQILSS